MSTQSHPQGEPGAEARAAASWIVAKWITTHNYHYLRSGDLIDEVAAALEAKERELRAVQDELANFKSGALDDYSLEIETLRGERDTLAQQLEALRMVVVKWQSSCRSTRQVEETDECIAAWNKRAADAEQQLAELRTENERLKEHLTATQLYAETCGDELEAYKEHLAEAEQQLEQAVRLAVDLQIEAKNQAVREKLAQCEAGRVIWVAKEQAIERWLSSPAIAPIRERVRQEAAK